MSALGHVGPDPISWFLEVALGSSAKRIDRFESATGIHGQSWVEGRHLNLLTVMADKPGTGQFRRFIDECKLEYDSIGVWMIFNHDLAKTLRRYGFNRATVTHDGERLRGYRWKRSTPTVSGHSTNE